MESGLMIKLQRILALASHEGGNENEKLLAMEKLNKLLFQHNLSISELEMRGQKGPEIVEKEHDLGKAAFAWKVSIAEIVANHYFCYPLVHGTGTQKRIRFVGRPDNSEALNALYGWIIKQIQDLSREARQVYYAETGEHIDPLRWQINFGNGIVSRIGDRLEEIKRRRADDNKVHALVIHHESEISDYFEEKYGWRKDGQMTAEQRKAKEEWKRKSDEKEAFRIECEKNGDMELFYERYPFDRPSTPEEIEAAKKRNEEWDEKWKAQQARSERSRRAAATRRNQKGWTETEYKKHVQTWSAYESGEKNANKVNLEPFLKAGQKDEALA